MDRAGVLSRRNVEPALGPDLGEGRKILRRPYRLFEEQWRGRAAIVRERDRGGLVHWAVHVDHQRNAGADGLPRRYDGRHGGLMQLDRREAAPQRRLAFAGDEVRLSNSKQACIGRNVRAFAGTEQTVQRHALRAGGEVPQRDVEAGDREHGDAVTAEQMQVALDAIHERGNAGGIRHLEAARLRRDHLGDGLGGGLRTHIAPGIAPAGQPGVGRNLDDDDVDRCDR